MKEELNILLLFLVVALMIVIANINWQQEQICDADFCADSQAELEQMRKQEEKNDVYKYL